MRLCGHGHLVELIGADLGRRPVAVPLDDPGPVVGLLEGLERQAKLLDGLEAPHPQQVLLQRRMNRSAQPLPSGSRTKAGELSTPRKRISPWKWWLTY